MGTYSTGQATQDTLVNAAGELAAEKGFSNVPIRAVADRSGQNIGSIHYHFKSKKKLFEAVILAATRAIRERPIKDIIASFENRLDQPEIQAIALRAIVQR
ncbi:MAG: helix-turn-helix domain-containing protein, partial [Pseudomonadota bacterium]